MHGEHLYRDKIFLYRTKPKMGKDAFTKLVELGYVSGPVKQFNGDMLYQPTSGSAWMNGTYSFLDYGNGTAMLNIEIDEPESGSTSRIYFETAIHFLHEIYVNGNILSTEHNENYPRYQFPCWLATTDNHGSYIDLQEELSFSNRHLQCTFSITLSPELLRYVFDSNKAHWKIV